MVKTPSFVKNSQHFVEMIREMRVEENEVLVSFNVKSLFTNVPVDKALEVIQAKLLDDETLVERTGIPPHHVTHLLELCLRSTYFVFHGTYYQQQEGAAMGSSISPVVANICMKMFEELALRTATTCLRIWKRYVDDTFCVMERTHVHTFLEHLNSLRPTIKFTMELESDGRLAFLDTFLKRKCDGSLGISVYRKPMHTERYLQYSSHHSPQVKYGSVSCVFHRARTLVQGENLRSEEIHLREVLKDNVYPEHVIKKAAKPRPSREPDEQPRATIYIPYVSGLSEDIRGVCRKHHIKTVYKTPFALHHQLMRVKDTDPLEKRAGVIYQLPCSECEFSYIGETKRPLETCL